MRVGILSLYHESNTFISAPTTLADFERAFVATGAEVAARFTWSHHEVAGFFAGLSDAGIEPVPLIVAWALPSGPIAGDTWATLTTMLREQLAAAGPLDGVLAAPHGAAVTSDGHAVDGSWVELVRNHVSDRVPIIATCDPHANISRQLVNACDALIAYRTNPHLDQRQRGLEAARLMARTLRGEVRPVLAAALPPVAINIERQHTSSEPCATLFREANGMLCQPGVLSNSIVLGFPYADVAEMGSSVLMVADGDRELAQRLANQLAGRMWADRQRFEGQLIEVDQAIEVTRGGVPGPSACSTWVIMLAACAPGDGTVLAHALARAGIKRSFISLCDPEAAQRAIGVGVGAALRLSMGAKADQLHGEPLIDDVAVRGIHSGQFSEAEARHGGMTSFDMGPTAIVETPGGLTVQITSRRTFPVSLGQLTSCGLDPLALRVIVAKGVHAPLGAYEAVCPTIVRVNTPGVTCADLGKLHYHHRRRPMYPFERDATWASA